MTREENVPKENRLTQTSKTLGNHKGVMNLRIEILALKFHLTERFKNRSSKKKKSLQPLIILLSELLVNDFTFGG